MILSAILIFTTIFLFTNIGMSEVVKENDICDIVICKAGVYFDLMSLENNNLKIDGVSLI